MKQKFSRHGYRFQKINQMMEPKVKKKQKEEAPLMVLPEFNFEDPYENLFKEQDDVPYHHQFIMVGPGSMEKITMTMLAHNPPSIEVITPFRAGETDRKSDLNEQGAALLAGVYKRIALDSDLRLKMFEKEQSFVVMPDKIVAFDQAPTSEQFAELVQEALKPKILSPFPDFKPKKIP